VARGEWETDGRPGTDSYTTLEREQPDLTPVPGGGRHGPRGIKSKGERPVALRNVTDTDSRLMQDCNGGMIQGYNAQPAVIDDGLILSPRAFRTPTTGGNHSR
jgi:hypothetical protein